MERKYILLRLSESAETHVGPSGKQTVDLFNAFAMRKSGLTLGGFFTDDIATIDYDLSSGRLKIKKFNLVPYLMAQSFSKIDSLIDRIAVNYGTTLYALRNRAPSVDEAPALIMPGRSDVVRSASGLFIPKGFHA